jgi:hypothetical protein
MRGVGNQHGTQRSGSTKCCGTTAPEHFVTTVATLRHTHTGASEADLLATPPCLVGKHMLVCRTEVECRNRAWSSAPQGNET